MGVFMDKKDVLDYVKENQPTVWKKTKPYLIKKDDVKEFLSSFKDKLEKNGFRSISFSEGLQDTLKEAEEHFKKDDK